MREYKNFSSLTRAWHLGYMPWDLGCLLYSSCAFQLMLAVVATIASGVHSASNHHLIFIITTTTTTTTIQIERILSLLSSLRAKFNLTYQNDGC
jgi:hypothetical protein